jgi:predicted pyridoxine 5'-phosphate oxidase superfamily flavin-nucleotide-binding protein
MARRYTQIAFTPAVKAVQEQQGSRKSYARLEQDEARPPDPLGEDEAEFIAARDSFYMATVSETGWPYLQHRGGPPGFVRVVDEHTIAFPDFRGNRQYISLGNLAGDDRVALIFMDYPNRRRLKLLGHASIAEVEGERVFMIRVEGFDWNCPQHITPRYTIAELERSGSR